MPLLPWLLSIVGSLVGRVLLALGFSVVTIVGFEVAVTQLKGQLVASANSMPADIFNLFLMAGGGIAMNAILGAIAFRVTMWAVQRSTRILGSGG